MKNKEVKEKRSGISIKTIAIVASFLSLFVSVFLIISLFMISNKFTRVQESTNDYMQWKTTALEVREASDYLTDQSRYYVINKHKLYMDNYFEEANVTKRRDHALEIMNQYLPDTKAREGIEQAVEKSKALMLDEFYAMRLIVESLHISMDDTYPVEIKETYLTPTDMALNDEEKVDLAFTYVFGEKYLEYKEFITTKVNYAVTEIDTLMEKNVISSTESLKKFIVIQQILVWSNILILGGVIVFAFVYIVKPLNSAVKKVENHEDMEIYGVKEFRYFAKTYNTVRAQSNNVKEKLKYEAEHDKLTSLYNRTGYDSIYRHAKLSKCYYILIDVDYFKSVNDEHGHEIGDKVLMQVANTISQEFDKDNEYTFRLGGDEFAILIENNDDITSEQLVAKCESITEKINAKDKKLPNITLSIGIAKGEKDDTTDSLFKKADKALYTAKNTGRHNITVCKK